jgi:hypothetical protein
MKKKGEPKWLRNLAKSINTAGPFHYRALFEIRSWQTFQKTR